MTPVAKPAPERWEGGDPNARAQRLRKGLRVALVHDWLNQMGGAENVLEELVGLFPGAPVFTSMYGPEKMPDAYRAWPIHTSFMQNLPGVTQRHQAYLPLYPAAFAATDLSGFDLIPEQQERLLPRCAIPPGRAQGASRLLLPDSDTLLVAI